MSICLLLTVTPWVPFDGHFSRAVLQAVLGGSTVTRRYTPLQAVLDGWARAPLMRRKATQT